MLGTFGTDAGVCSGGVGNVLGNRTSLGKRAIILLVIATLVWSAGAAPGFAQAAVEEAKPATVQLELPAEEAELFELFQKIKETILLLYPDPVDVQALYQGAIRGLLEALGDPYCEFLDEEQFEAMYQELEGEFSGIGVTIQLISGNITVVSVFKGSPAQRAGILPGDVITKVDDTDVQGKSLQDASALIRGEPGTQVVVTVFRPRTGEILVLPMIRARLTAHPVEMEELGDGMFYIRISQFTSTTGKNFAVLMEHIRRKGGRGLILDLRDNPGGLLDAAVEVAEELVPRGLIVELRRKQLREVIRSDKDREAFPTVILINGGSASASEIVAGAVRDRGKAILVGEPTFGKASVQAMFPLEGMGGFKLTVAEYFTPSGAQISGVGIKPNVRVEQEYVRLPGAVAYTRDMKKGTVGLDVLALQQALEFLGYNPGPADGVFGPRTEAAVIAFLRDYGRQYTGSVGQSEVSAVNGAVSDKGVNLPDNVLEEGIELLRQWIAMQ